MYKILGIVLMVTVVSVVLMLGTPTTLAQEWKTYYKPYSYSIDYPTLNGTANITESEGSIVVISIPGFVISVISIPNIAGIDPQEQAIRYRIDDVNKGLEAVTEVQLIAADLTYEYGYSTIDSNSLTSTSNMFFQAGEKYYHIGLEGVTYDKSSVDLFADRIEKVQSSLKFFD